MQWQKSQEKERKQQTFSHPKPKKLLVGLKRFRNGMAASMNMNEWRFPIRRYSLQSFAMLLQTKPWDSPDEHAIIESGCT